MMTKIVGTIGPVSEGSESMQKLVDEGLYIMRMNFSHATYDEAKNRLINLQSSKGVHSKYGSKFNLRASLLDTQGPEIRTGGVSKNYPDKKIKLEEGIKLIRLYYIVSFLLIEFYFIRFNNNINNFRGKKRRM